MSKPKILLCDIETFPLLSYTWARYEQDVVDVIKETCIATFAAKWLGKPVFAKALPDYAGYKPGSYDDKALVLDLWKLLDEADVCIAHNGDDFDFRVIRSRFLFHGLKPPSPFKTIDTKKVAKRVGRFSSNRLNDLGKYLGEGEKIKTDFNLWLGCINGDKDCWDRMVRYNKRDVQLLEKLYLRFLPWIDNHPNRALYDPSAICPTCGSKNVQARGLQVTVTRRYQRYQCLDCGHWLRSVKSEGGVKATNCV